MNEVVLLCNWMFFAIVVLPSMLRCVMQSFKYFQVLDIFYKSFHEKMTFCIGIVLIMYRQWINGNVIRLDKNRYEIRAILDGELCTIALERDDNSVWKSTYVDKKLQTR